MKAAHWEPTTHLSSDGQGFEAWSPESGLNPLMSCLCWVRSLGPDRYMVYSGHIRVEGLGLMLRPHGSEFIIPSPQY